ncbi:hypothetical protein ACPDHL_02450 [Myroides sp. C15-4]|uniref:hypothetical protein n=1 Tax=Myroides sp. C15-4 TaxID=3400532 RepID=UPI003D2F91E3
MTCRLTYKEQRKQFATGLFLKPEHWQNTKQRAHPPNEENNFIKTNPNKNGNANIVEYRIFNMFIVQQE